MIVGEAVSPPRGELIRKINVVEPFRDLVVLVAQGVDHAPSATFSL